MIKPEFLYKYRSGSEKDIKTLKKGKIFVPNFYKLNDIFEDDFEFEMNLAIKHANVRFPIIIKDQFGEPQFAPLILTSDQLTDQELQINENRIRVAVEAKRLEIFSKGVYSLCENFNDHRMWAHYANEHKGYCIKYRILTPTDPLIIPRPVEYLDRPAKIEWAIIHEYPTRIIEFYMIGNKPKDYKYEAEWRIIYPEGGKEYSIPFEVEGIVFGYRAEESLKKDLYEIFGDKINYYKIEKIKNSFDITVKEIKK
jgi:Protein of unknown function (DUF2971)